MRLMAPKKAKQPTADEARKGGVNMTTVKLGEGEGKGGRSISDISRTRSGGKRTYLKSQLLMVLTAFALVRVLRGLISAG